MDIYTCDSDIYLTLSKGESEYSLLKFIAKELIKFSSSVVIDGKLYSRHSRVADFEVDSFIDINSGILDIKLDGVHARIESIGKYGVFVIKKWGCKVALTEILDLDSIRCLNADDLIVTDMNNFKGKALDELLKSYQQYRLKDESDWGFRKRAFFSLFYSEKTSILVCLILGASTDCFSPSDWIFWTRYSELTNDLLLGFIDDIKIDPVRKRLYNGH